MGLEVFPPLYRKGLGWDLTQDKSDSTTCYLLCQRPTTGFWLLTKTESLGPDLPSCMKQPKKIFLNTKYMKERFSVKGGDFWRTEIKEVSPVIIQLIVLSKMSDMMQGGRVWQTPSVEEPRWRPPEFIKQSSREKRTTQGGILKIYRGSSSSGQWIPESMLGCEETEYGG